MHKSITIPRTEHFDKYELTIAGIRPALGVCSPEHHEEEPAQVINIVGQRFKRITFHPIKP